MIIAASLNHVDIVQCLVEAKAKLEARQKVSTLPRPSVACQDTPTCCTCQLQDGTTALWAAAANGHDEVVEFLLEEAPLTLGTDPAKTDCTEKEAPKAYGVCFV